MASEMITINHLTKRYDNDKLALEDINLTIAENEFVTVIGPQAAVSQRCST